MPSISRGFHGTRRTEDRDRLPPGQYTERGFPVLTIGPTPRVDLSTWRLKIDGLVPEPRTWSWDELMALDQEDVHTDIHCVTKWSKFDTRWRGVSLDTLLEGVHTDARYVLARSVGGYTTNLPLADLRGGKAWIAHTYDGAPLPPEHGGPARLLVPHLYFWKSAKWVSALTLMAADEPGFWEQNGYHDYGDPWLQQRYQGD